MISTLILKKQTERVRMKRMRPPTIIHLRPQKSVSRIQTREPSIKPTKQLVPYRPILASEQQRSSGTSVMKFDLPLSVSKKCDAVRSVLQAMSLSQGVMIPEGEEQQIEILLLSCKYERPQMILPTRVQSKVRMTPARIWQQPAPPTLMMAASVLRVAEEASSSYSKNFRFLSHSLNISNKARSQN